MLFFSGEHYFVQRIVIEDANDKQMQALTRIITQVRPNRRRRYAKPPERRRPKN